MSEFQKCQKCGKTFARVDRSGTPFFLTGDTMRHVGEKMCPSCGGRVIWVDESGFPMGGYRSQERDRPIRLGCLYGIVVALIGWLVYYFLND